MINSDNQNITNRIKDLLKNNKSLSQKELATYLQKAPSTISQWLTQNRDIPAECIIPICEYLDCSINWLLTGTEAIDRKTSVSGTNVQGESILISYYRKMDSIDKEEILLIAKMKADKIKGKNNAK